MSQVHCRVPSLLIEAADIQINLGLRFSNFIPFLITALTIFLRLKNAAAKKITILHYTTTLYFGIINRVHTFRLVPYNIHKY